jgi:DNA invertase Pin-like site-specific DNA recombinase
MKNGPLRRMWRCPAQSSIPIFTAFVAVGRPKVSAAVEDRIRKLLRAGVGINTTARKVGVGTGTVQRIKQEMTGPFAVAAA